MQGALLCLETETGLVKAMVGGRDFNENQFNRAIQSRRQPGSSFKPIIYAAALDRKFNDPRKVYTPATVIIDSAVVFEDRVRDQTWKPKNYRETFYGPTLLREALAQSRNVVTVKILQDIGVDYTIDYARKLGISSDLTRTLSLALGSSGVSLFELTRAYSVFANQGYLVEPVFTSKIVDRDGKVLEEAVSDRRKVIEKDTAFIMTSLMESVVQHGTGQRIKALGRPSAGKTGTTNDMYDAWYIGYTPEYMVTGVWVGFDTEAPLGKSETGRVGGQPHLAGVHEAGPGQRTGQDLRTRRKGWCSPRSTPRPGCCRFRNRARRSSSASRTARYRSSTASGPGKSKKPRISSRRTCDDSAPFRSPGRVRQRLTPYRRERSGRPPAG